MNYLQELERLKNEQKILVDLIRKLENQQDRLQVEELALSHMIQNDEGKFDTHTDTTPTTIKTVLNDQPSNTQDYKEEIPSLDLNPNRFYTSEQQEVEEEDDEDDDTDVEEQESVKKFTVL